MQCQSCKAISVFPAERVAQRCEFCGSSALVPYEQAKPPISPESLLPFKFSESNARDAVRKWYGGVWFAPDRLKKAALTDTVKGMYLPYWTFDSRVHCDWQAEAGYYYYTTESYTDDDGQNKTREVREVRWEAPSGAIDHFFDDELVPASKGVAPRLLRAVEPFPTTSDLVKYDPGFLSGWVVEQYQIDLIAAAQNARNQMTVGTGAIVLGRSAGRHPAQPADFAGVFGRHLQAHSAADLAAFLHLRRTRLAGGDQRLRRQTRRRISQELGQNYAPRARDSDRDPHHRRTRREAMTSLRSE